MSLRQHTRAWEDLGAVDPLWAILSFPENRFGKGNVDTFFRSGDQEIDQVMQTARLLGYPHQLGSALDFGCGVGRLTPALAKRFHSYYGVDIAASMIAGAKRYHDQLGNCQFIVNREDNLSIFGDDQIDLIYTNYVLQHLPSRTLMRSYIREFMRVVRPGGLVVFQLPDRQPILRRIQPRRRLYPMLRNIGFSERFIYRRLGIAPMSTTFMREREVVPFLTGIGGQILYIQRHLARPGSDDSDADARINPPGQNRVYFVTKQENRDDVRG